MSGNDQYLNLFLVEAKEQLDGLNHLILKLEKNPDDISIVHEIFRVAHTLKGMSAAMGFDAFKELTHRMEDLFGVFKDLGVTVTREDVDLLLSCLDALSEDTQQIEQGAYQNTEHTELCKHLAARFQTYQDKEQNKEQGKEAAGKNTPKSQPDVVTPNSDSVHLDIEDEDSEFSPYKQWIEEQLTLAEANQKLNPGEYQFYLHINLKQDAPLGTIRAHMVQDVITKKGYKIVTVAPDINNINDDEASPAEFIWIYQGLERRLEDLKNTILAEVSDIDTVETYCLNEALDVADSEKEATSEKSQKQETAGNKSASVSGKTVRIPMERIDTLVNLVGELVIDRTRLDQFAHSDGSSELLSLVGSLGGISNELQELVMKFRMEPISHMFSLFPRVVRDLSKTLAKQVELVIIGEDTEVDRVVNEELSGPLMHLIRNSLDHGLESPDDRLAAGKPAMGTIKVSAVNQGDCIHIQITDDGKGLDAQKILKKAIERQVVTAEQARQLSESEIHQLVMLPGFSTAEVTTDISGRGVGMDVVNTAIAKLSGDIKLISQEGKGTTIDIILPTNMAIIDVLLVTVGHGTYALPLASIREVVEVGPEDLKPVQTMEMLMVRGNPLPLIRLPQALDPEFTRKDKNVSILAVIVRVQDREYCLEVSSLIGQQEAVVKSMPKQVSSDKVFSGVMTLGSGEVCLILNPAYAIHLKPKQSVHDELTLAPSL